MSKLHIYTVHINPALTEPYEAAQFIEEGFSWKAFIFTLFWTLYHKLWWQTAVLFVFNVILFNLFDEKILTHSAYTIIALGVHLIVGFSGDDWRRAKLKHKGYITADIVTSDSLLRAEQRFFDRYFANRSAPPFVA